MNNLKIIKKMSGLVSRSRPQKKFNSSKTSAYLNKVIHTYNIIIIHLKNRYLR